MGQGVIREIDGNNLRDTQGRNANHRKIESQKKCCFFLFLFLFMLFLFPNTDIGSGPQKVGIPLHPHLPLRSPQGGTGLPRQQYAAAAANPQLQGLPGQGPTGSRVP
jgi:hypothetical protein